MARVTDPRDYLDPPSRRIYNQTLEEEIMAHITPDNFNMYISSLKLDTDRKTVYGPQLTEVCVVKSEIVGMVLALLLVIKT